jgi:hypothetical protein
VYDTVDGNGMSDGVHIRLMVGCLLPSLFSLSSLIAVMVAWLAIPLA